MAVILHALNEAGRRKGGRGPVEIGGRTMRFHRDEDRNDVSESSPRSGEVGLSLIEILVILVVITLLATIGLTEFQNYRERTKLVKCMAEIRGIQAAVYSMGDGRYIPDPIKFWESAFPDGRKHGPYYYIVDGDPNSGHGNDLDEIDEQNPGDSPENREEKDIKFVIFCEHAHGDLGKYVYLTDMGAPIVVQGDGDDPGFDKFIKWEYGGPGAKKHK